MSTREKIIDDVAKVAGGAVSLLSDVAKQTNAAIRAKADDIAHNMNLVPREDFEKLELMIATMREEQEAMKKRVELLEQTLLKKK